MLKIRKAVSSDHDAIWKIFHEIVALSDTYPYLPGTDRQEALDIWVDKPAATYVAELDGKIVGTYYIKPNQPGLGAHICNSGYMVPAEARSLGIGRSMCQHSQEEALRLGFRAIQFNLVVSSNLSALRLWQELGFDVIGTLPGAFNHGQLGFIDAYVMYKWIDK